MDYSTKCRNDGFQEKKSGEDIVAGKEWKNN